MKEPSTKKTQNSWWCDTCSDSQKMTHSEMLEHLKNAHGLETKGLKCKKSMLMHLDGSDFYSSTWQVTIVPLSGSEIKMTNATCNPRSTSYPSFMED
jgi:hypothetical protein